MANLIINELALWEPLAAHRAIACVNYANTIGMPGVPGNICGLLITLNVLGAGVGQEIVASVPGTEHFC